MKQPFYYVGLQSVTNREIKLWAYPEVENEYSNITTLPEGAMVTVLLKRDEPYPHYTYLVKTEFGLVGWVRFKPAELYMWNKPNPIEGLYFIGD